MKKTKILSHLAIFILLSLLISCGSSKKFDFNEYYDQLNEDFKIGTTKFFNADYIFAKNLFINYNQVDSNFSNYESYAFLAECYNKLGMQDSGKIIYQNIIHKLSNISQEKQKALRNIELITEDVIKWYDDFPNFPDELKKENGFKLDDELPIPIGGIKEIQKFLTYPYNSSGVRLEGRVFLATLINENGKIIDFEILESIGKPYEEAAINALKQINFTMPKRKGTPHKIWVAIPILFKGS